MSTHDRASVLSFPWLLRIIAVVVVTGALALVVGLAGHGDAAAGIVTGGLVVAVLAGIGRWRSVRVADRTGSAARIAAGRADERDLRVRQATFAAVGKVALGVSALASAATFLGVDATAVLRGIPFVLVVLVVTVVVAYLVVDRRS